MLAKWAEDDRQAIIKEQQRRQKMLEYRQLCQKLDLERHKQLIVDKVKLCLSVCLSVCLLQHSNMQLMRKKSLLILPHYIKNVLFCTKLVFEFMDL